MLHLFAGLDLHTGLLLLLALAFVLFYEAINGFHDTANAVATVIYTRAMRSQLAVVMAAVFNFLGVLLGGLSVAYAIVHMLPTDLLLNMGSSHGLAMVFSMLLAAIIWNLGTWYFGLPASSSHTLIGAIIGIGLTNALMTGTSVVDALNIPKVLSIFGSLIVSPIVGLVFAGGLIFLLRRYWSGTKKRARIHLTPAEREKKDGKKKPPFWTRIALILSAIGVAFSHGANDGQKGMTYAQGMSAQMTAAVSIGLASYTGMPVSTTHVLSSSVAGTMVVDGGGLQRKTVTSILMAWVFTLPAAVLLSGGLYWLSLQFL
ncbi:TPA: inorganic phosphate transporter [Escherichia coli]